jgi:hypothetical protein
MVEPNPTPRFVDQALVPRYVRALEALGARRGFSVSIAIAPVQGYERKVEHLVGEWRGSWRQFLSLKFTVLSFRRPLIGGAIVVRTNSPIRDGYVEMDGKVVKFLPDFGPVPVGIQHSGVIEIIRYEERVAFHGSMAALIAAHVPKARLIPPPLRTWRAGSSKEPFGECRWSSRRQPDGSIVYTVDTEQAERARKARIVDGERRMQEYEQKCARWERERSLEPAATEPQRPSYLRLVVDHDSV